MNGDPKLDASQRLPAFDYAAYARLLGLEGICVEAPEDVGPAWDRALAAGRPAVIDVAFEQAREMASALRRDPARGEIIRHSLRGKLAEFLAR